MQREFTCIVCPNGCRITADYEKKEDGSLIIRSVEGQTCRRGEEYVRQELTDPRRTIASSAAVKGGEMPLCSVRLTAPVPKKEIFRVMEAIREITLEAPVEEGTVILSNVLGYDADLIATRTVHKA
jgi:CxxC motif-containing protein